MISHKQCNKTVCPTFNQEFKHICVLLLNMLHVSTCLVMLNFTKVELTYSCILKKKALNSRL